MQVSICIIGLSIITGDNLEDINDMDKISINVYSVIQN